MAPTRPSAWFTVALTLSLLSALVLSAAWTCRQNTLYRNGHWVSTKAAIGHYLLGSVACMVTTPALAFNQLNLGTWHGFQEMTWRQPLTLQKASFDCKLPDESWVTLVFNKTDQGFEGLRLSRAPADPSGLLVSDPNGRFLSWIPLPLTTRPGWNHVDMVRDDHHWYVTLDGQRVTLWAGPARLGGCGFRGCLNLSAVDNVLLQGPEATARDTFDHDAAIPALLLWAWPLAAVVTASLFLYLRGRRDGGPALVTTHLWVLVAALVVYGVQWFYYGPRYPKTIDYSQFPEYRNYIDAAPDAKSICDNVQIRYGNVPFPGRRVLFVGSSQTWGAGATSDDHTWVRQLEKRLQLVAGPVQCVNAGVSGFLSQHCLQQYEHPFLSVYPQIAVIDLGFNDAKVDALVANVGKMLDLDDQQGVKSLLILEPNCPQYHDANMPKKQAALQALAERRHVPYIDMQTWLTQHDGDGFLWWDMVHLTNYGQELFADRVYPELLKLLNETPLELVK